MRVRVVVPTLGGGYGGKAYPTIEPITALLDGKPLNSRDLGYALRRVRGRMVDGMHFKPLEGKKNGYTQWILEVAATMSGVGDPPPSETSKTIGFPVAPRLKRG